MQKMIINLWFKDQAEAAATFYCGVFADSELGTIAYYPDTGQEITGQTAGSVMTVYYRLNDMYFVALNGGQQGFKFNESISIIVNCDTQEEIDHYWQALTADGGNEVQCGWLKDKYGLSWQIVTPKLDELLASADEAVAKRVMDAMLKMKKISIPDLEAAAKGE